jgi:hypothetical protein
MKTKTAITAKQIRKAFELIATLNERTDDAIIKPRLTKAMKQVSEAMKYQSALDDVARYTKRLSVTSRTAVRRTARKTKRSR